jgi:hypothetical protein
VELFFFLFGKGVLLGMGLRGLSELDLCGRGGVVFGAGFGFALAGVDVEEFAEAMSGELAETHFGLVGLGLVSMIPGDCGLWWCEVCYYIIVVIDNCEGTCTMWDLGRGRRGYYMHCWVRGNWGVMV